MRVIVIGAGKVGYRIAETLSLEGYNVVVIDKDEDVIRRVSENLDVMAIRANGLGKQPLKELGVDKDDWLIAMMENDAGNMISCLAAKNLGVGQTIARIRDPELINDLAISQEDVAVDYVINPEGSTAREISRWITLSPAGQLEDFAEGRVQIVQVPVKLASPLAGMPIQAVGQLAPILVAGISRDGRLIIPSGADRIQGGDELFVTGKSADVTAFCDSLGMAPHKPRNLLIVGGGRLSYYLAKDLVSQGLAVKIIESNLARCQELSELLPQVLVIHGDGTDVNLLKAENIAEMDAFVALTGRDEENLLVALLAKQLGSRRAIAKVSRPNYIHLSGTIGIDGVVTPSLITTAEILRIVRGGRIMSLFLIFGGEAEIMELPVDPSAPAANTRLRDLPMPRESLMTTVVRGDEVIVPRGDTVIKPQDRVIVICKVERNEAIRRLFGEQGRILDGFWKRLARTRLTSRN